MSKPQIIARDGMTTVVQNKYLLKLIRSVSYHLAAMDEVMKEPSTVERGMKIARLCNELDIANDSAMHFGMDYSFGRVNREKNAALWKAKGTKP